MTASRDPHEPMMSEERVRQVRAWHDAHFRSAERNATVRMTFFDREFVVPPDIHPPQGVSDLLATAVLAEVRDSDSCSSVRRETLRTCNT